MGQLHPYVQKRHACAPGTKPARSHCSDNRQKARRLRSTLPRVSLTSHDDLRSLLVKHELPARLADRAAWGFALSPGGFGRSKLGGLPEIPQAWPMNNGRGLTHLASIALEELPDSPARSHLPSDGTLVFFADFSEENEGWGPADNSEPVIEVLHVPAGTNVTVATPPDEQRGEYEVPVVLNERRIRFEPVVTMPYDEEAADEFEDSYDAFCEQVESPDHLLLGEPLYIQEDPRSVGEISLLQLNWDEDLGYMHGDGGQISFYGAANDLRAGRWQSIKATPDSS
jgi:uncharacterized protein YwqG